MRQDGLYLSAGGELIWVSPRMLGGWLFGVSPVTAGDVTWAEEILAAAEKEARRRAAERKEGAS